MTAYAIQAVEFNATTIKGKTDANLDPRLVEDAEESSGHLHQTGHHYIQSAPMLSGTTRDLQGMATLCSGNADVPFVLLTAANLFGAAMNPDAPGYKGTSVHQKWAAAAGGLAWNRLSWSPRGKVELGYDAYFIETNADGSTYPLTGPTNAALPTQNAWNAAYTLQSVTLGGSALKHFRALEVNIEHGIENNVGGTCYDGGLPHPIQLAMPGAHGPIRVDYRIDAQDITLAPSNGDLVLTFVELTEGGFVGADTVVVTINATIDPKFGLQQSQGDPNVVSVIGRGIDDGSTKPITVTP